MENRYGVLGHPGPGDICYFDHAKCLQCGHNVHVIQFQYFRKTALTEAQISDKHDRGKYQDFIESGRAFIIPGHLDEIPRNTKAQILACEWTLKTMQPADSVIDYLRLNREAPWVSNQASEQLRRDREGWLKSLKRKQLGGGDGDE